MTKAKTMQITREQMAVHAFAMRDREDLDDEDRPVTNVLITDGGVTFATNREALAAVKANTRPDDDEPFVALVPAASVGEASRAMSDFGAEVCELAPANGKGIHLLTWNVEGKETVTEVKKRLGEDTAKFPNIAEAMKPTSKPKGRVALDSTLLEKVCKLRKEVGGKGTIFIEFGGESDSVRMGWTDGLHRVVVVLGPDKADNADWQSALGGGK